MSRLRRALAGRVRAIAKRIIRPIIVREPNFPAKYLAYEEDKANFLIAKPTDRPTVDPKKLEIPPQDLWVATGPGGYGASDEDYLAIGEQTVAAMLELLRSGGGQLGPSDRVLDFGCASGRLIRWFARHAETAETWGVDISAPHVVWCQTHLSPPFRFLTSTTLPHLPFEERYFRLIYAGSVFTHIDELADAWFMELRRILDRGGHLYVTVNDKHSMEVILRNPEFNLAKRIADARESIPIDTADFGAATINRAYTLYDIDYLKRKLEPLFEIVAVRQEAYGFQTGILLRKR